MSTITIVTSDYYWECGEPSCCSEWGTDWTLCIDGEEVAEGSVADSVDAERAAMAKALELLGHTVNIVEKPQED